MREFTDQELARRGKLEKIKELGLDPFGQAFKRTAFASEIKDKYKDIPHEDFESMSDEATVAGRIMFIRRMGKWFKNVILYGGFRYVWCRNWTEKRMV